MNRYTYSRWIHYGELYLYPLWRMFTTVYLNLKHGVRVDSWMCQFVVRGCIVGLANQTFSWTDHVGCAYPNRVNATLTDGLTLVWL